ncbi:hypothetical protein V8B97DRAFT_1914157 [Scleroderma yunnanense]
MEIDDLENMGGGPREGNHVGSQGGETKGGPGDDSPVIQGALHDLEMLGETIKGVMACDNGAVKVVWALGRVNVSGGDPEEITMQLAYIVVGATLWSKLFPYLMQMQWYLAWVLVGMLWLCIE